MAFKISAYRQVSEEQKELYTYSNCSEFSFIKDNVYYTDGTNNTFPVINFNVYEDSVKKEHTINTLHVGGGKLYCLTHIQLLNSSKKTRYIIPASSISEENENEFLFNTENLLSKNFKNTDLTSTSTVYVYFVYSYCEEIVYPISEQKYFGYPKIIYGDSNANTVISDYIYSNNNVNRFWICENKAGEYATSFDYWNIRLYRLTKENDVYTSNFVCAEKYTGVTHFLSSVQFFQPGIDSTPELVLVRNENLIKSDDFRKTSIYNTYNDELLNGNICYFIVEASYTAKSPRVVFWKRNGDVMMPKYYKYGEVLSNNPLRDSEINMTKRGYTFDGYYIKSSGDKDDIQPAEGTTLDNDKEYRKIVNSDGTYIASVADFTGDNYEYINIIPEKYAYGNWIPKTTTIKLNWNIARVEGGSTITINGTVANDTQISNLNSLNTSAYNTFGLSYSTTEIFNTTCENLIRDKGIKIPTITEKVGNQTITWKFCGFYKEKGLSEKIVDENGVFKRNTTYTSAKKWDTDKSSVTLYAKWVKGAYYEVDKDGFEGAWGSCPDGYKAYYGSGSHTTPKGNKQLDMDMPYLCYYEKGDYVRDSSGNPVIDNDMNFDGYFLYNADGTRGQHIVRWDGVFKLCTSCTNLWRRNKKEGKVNLYGYWYGDKFRIQTESDNTRMGTTSGGGRYKKTRDCTITASVKDTAKYSFRGWQKDGVSLKNGFISTSLNYTFKVKKAEKYIGYFGAKSYIINYKDVGNTECTAENYININSPTFTATIVSNNDEYLPPSTSWWGIGIPKAYKKNYVFKGWYKDSAGTIELDKDEKGGYIIGEGVTNNITLYAKWEKATIEGRYILKPGKGAWKTDVNLPQIDTTIVYGNKMPSINKDLIPVLEGHSFTGFYDKNFHKVIGKECTDWIKNTYYVDGDGNSKMDDTYVFTANFSKDMVFDPGDGNIIAKTLNCNITTHSNVDFKNSIENKIATIDWINTAIGIPEINHYDDLIKKFYNSNMVETYNSSKGLADKYFFNDFDFDDNKLLKQSDIIEFFDNSATELKNDFYLKEIKYDVSNNKTIMSINFIERSRPLYSSGYRGSKDTIIYFTINDDKSVVYKMCIDEIKEDRRFEINLKYFDIEFPHLTDYINKITIEHISCFAIDNLDNIRTYYKPYLVFNKFKDLNLTIEENTILNNVEIKEYETDSLLKPSIPEGDIIA